MIELIQDIMVIYTVTKFGADWFIIANASVNNIKYGKFSNSMADNLDSSGLITSIIELIRDLMVTYILTKFGSTNKLLVNICRC